MAKEWYLMGNPQIYNGGFEGDEWKNYAQEGFQEMLDTTMLTDDVEFINSDFSVIIPGKAIIQGVTPDLNTKTEDRQILVPIGTLQRFSYIRFNGEVWIISSEPYNNKFYEKATLKICKNQLRWQNQETKEIFNYWYWMEDISLYNSGIYNAKIITTSDKLYKLLLPMDKNTRKLHDGMRFIFEFSDDVPLVYKLTDFNGVMGNNKNVKLLSIVVSQTVYDPDRDNLDLMIADYYPLQENSKHEDLSDHSYNVKIDYASDEIKLSSFGKFTAIFYDDHMKEMSEYPEYTWSITDCDFNDYLVCSESGNTMKIVVKNNKELVGRTFDLNVALPDETILATVKIRITALW